MTNNAEPSFSQQNLAPPQIESVEILELLGKGGMSLVYKARQKQLDRIVAVKVLSKIAVRGEDGIKRFQNEARLTSSLEHPNIVKTISFGVSKDEQPYLIMEYLEGLSLADEMKKHGRLQLQKFKDVFLPALSALNQAHEAGMVHRDIKPGNIMICRTDNGDETVKLVDFGIAKVIGEGKGEDSNLTKSGAVIGSPTYMSPEQCLGKPLDGRSDLYSIACVMYETLSGEPPFSGDSLLDVMQKHAAAPPPTVAELSRKIDIRRELADVTLWGLAKDPNQRPQTASEFARKLSEVLERITLDKVPRAKNTSSESSQKMRSIAPAVVSVLVLAGVFCLVLNQQRKPTVKRDTPGSSALRQKTIEERQFAELMAKPIKTPEIADQLDNRAEQYERNADLVHAEKLRRRSLESREKLLGKEHLDLAGCLANLGHCLFVQDKLAEAVSVFNRELRIRESSLEPTAPSIIQALSMLQFCYHELKEHSKEEAVFLHQLDLIEKSHGSNDRFLPEMLAHMADCYDQRKNLAKAEPLYKRAVLIAKKEFKSGDPKVGVLIFELARCHAQENKLKEAEAEAKEALVLLGRCAPDHEKVSSIFTVLGSVYEQEGDYAKSELYFQKGLQKDEQIYGKNDPRVINNLFRLANRYREEGKYYEAAPLFERILAILEKPGNNDRPMLRVTFSYLAECYAKQGKLEQASVMSKRYYALLDAQESNKR